MDKSPDNPSGNRLASGISEPNLIRAIESSGYPLQGVVVSKLQAEFGVTEEWGYIEAKLSSTRIRPESRCLQLGPGTSISGPSL